MNTLNIKLVRLRDDAEIARQVCIESMDRRSIYTSEMSNIYFKALYAYRVELRRVRTKEKNIMQMGENAGKAWRHGAVITREN